MRRHDVDLPSFLFALAFLALGLLLLGGDPAGRSVALSWAGPGAAIVVALVILLAIRTRPGTSRAEKEDAGPTADAGSGAA